MPALSSLPIPPVRAQLAAAADIGRFAGMGVVAEARSPAGVSDGPAVARATRR